MTEIGFPNGRKHVDSRPCLPYLNTDNAFSRWYTYLPTLPLGQDITQGLNSEFSFKSSCLTKAEKPSLSYYVGRNNRIHTFSQGY